jgi:hypothetical protein
MQSTFQHPTRPSIPITIAIRPRPNPCPRRTNLPDNLCYHRSLNQLIFCCNAHLLLLLKQLARQLSRLTNPSTREYYIRSLRRLNLMRLVLQHVNTNTRHMILQRIREIEMQEDADTDLELSDSQLSPTSE